jgi:hypothetical protein
MEIKSAIVNLWSQIRNEVIYHANIEVTYAAGDEATHLECFI